MQETCSGHRLQKFSTEIQRPKLHATVGFPPTSIKLQGQDGSLRTHLRLLPTPRSSPHTSTALVGIPLRCRQWVPLPLAIPQPTPVTGKTGPQEKTPSSSLLGSCQSPHFPPHGNRILDLARIMLHETRNFLELN